MVDLVRMIIKAEKETIGAILEGLKVAPPFERKLLATLELTGIRIF